MSHVTVVDASSGVRITDIDVLRRALELFCPTLELVKQNTYRTWATDHGSFVGDWPLPAGMKASEVGHNAEYVIRIKPEILAQRNTRYGLPYEIGLVPTQDGAYLPLVDFYSDGMGLFLEPGLGGVLASGEKVTGLDNLFMAYQVAVEEQAALQQGLAMEIQVQQDGTVLGTIELSDTDGVPL